MERMHAAKECKASSVLSKFKEMEKRVANGEDLDEDAREFFISKGWGLSVKLGKHSAIWGKLGTALQAYTLSPCTKFPPNPTSRKVNT